MDVQVGRRGLSGGAFRAVSAYNTGQMDDPSPLNLSNEMRRIGTVETASLAEKFCDYLVTRAIQATWEQEEGHCDVWIRDESMVETAARELAEFRQDSAAPRYAVQDQVRQIREQKVADNLKRMKNLKTFKPSRTPGRGMIGGIGRQQRIPVTIAIIAISVIVSFATNFGRVRIRFDGKPQTTDASIYLALSFVDRIDYITSQGDSFASIKKGQFWRFITPIFLHGSEMHLLFNMMALFSLGSAVERLHGSLAYAGIFLVAGLVGMMMQVLSPEWMPEPLRGTPFVIGASGAVYGLFGFIWIRPKIDSTYPIAIPPFNVTLMIGWLFVCMTPLMPNVANGAHLGGLLAGIVAAMVWWKKFN